MGRYSFIPNPHIFVFLLLSYSSSSRPCWPIRITYGTFKKYQCPCAPIPTPPQFDLFEWGGGVRALVFFKSSSDDSSVCLGLRNFALPHILTEMFSTLSQRLYNIFSELNNCISLSLSLYFMLISAFFSGNHEYTIWFLTSWPFWLLAKHLKTAFSKEL